MSLTLTLVRVLLYNFIRAICVPFYVLCVYLSMFLCYYVQLLQKTDGGREGIDGKTDISI